MKNLLVNLTVFASLLGCVFFCENVFAENNNAPASITSVHPQEMRQLVILHRKADELVLKNDFRGAIRTYLDILLLEPDDEAAYVGMGQSYMILGDLEQAKNAFQNALHIDPENDTAAYGLQKIMDPDGVAGMVTAPSPVLNPSTQDIQAALKNAGLYPGPVDGDLNSLASQKAIKDFQLENHLPIDGKIGPKTWLTLQRFLKSAKES